MKTNSEWAKFDKEKSNIFSDLSTHDFSPPDLFLDCDYTEIEGFLT